MGVGTNVQRLLKAMHHLDAPWRPADDEQRNGRIIRQGNLNPEVKIFRYITLRSLVAYKWQILTRKANFIAQLRAGARGVRTAEDIDSPLPEADMIKAAATGNPLIIEQAELAKELRELEAGQRGHERSIIAAKSAHERLLVKIAGLEETISGLAADAGDVQRQENAGFALSIGDRRYTDRKAAGEALRSILWSKTLGLEANTSGKAFLHAQMFGFKLEAYVRHGFSGLSYTVEVMRRRSYTSYDFFYLSENIDAVGLVRRFENAIRRVPAVLKAEEAELAKANADLPRLERQLNAPAFARSDRLQAVKSRIAEIEKALQPHPAEGQAPPNPNPPQIAGPAGGTPVGPPHPAPMTRQEARIGLLRAEHDEQI